MGVQIRFFLGAADGLPSIIAAGIGAYSDWLHAEAAQQPDWYVSEIAVLESLAPDAFNRQPRDADEAKLIVRVVNDFLDPYCNYGGGRSLLPAAHDHWVSRRDGEAALTELQKRGAAAAARLWAYLLDGRAVWPGGDKLPHSADYSEPRVGYWTHDECQTLVESLKPGFAGELAHARRGGGPFVPYDAVSQAIQSAAKAAYTAVDQQRGLVMTSG